MLFLVELFRKYTKWKSNGFKLFFKVWYSQFPKIQSFYALCSTWNLTPFMAFKTIQEEKQFKKESSHSDKSTGKCHVWRHKKRRDATRSKIKYKLHQKFGNPSFNVGRSVAVLIFSGWFPFQLLVASLLFRRIFMKSHTGIFLMLPILMLFTYNCPQQENSWI